MNSYVLLGAFPLFIAASTLSAQKPDTLRADDLLVSGIAIQSDTIAVRQHLGNPDEVRNPASTGPYRSFVIWRYKTLTAVFNAGKLFYLEIRGPSVRTGRGGRVGDTESTIKALYGSPMHADSSSLVYVRSFAPDESYGIIFRLRSGKVMLITVGDVLSPLD